MKKVKQSNGQENVRGHIQGKSKCRSGDQEKLSEELALALTAG